MIYLDTSVLLPLFRREALSERVMRSIAQPVEGGLAISHWCQTEFASVVAREVRMRQMTKANAQVLFGAFEQFCEASLTVFTVEPTHFALATQYVREFDTALRGPDALHLAVASRADIQAIFTLDAAMFTAGKRLGLPVVKSLH
jgi:predicted nucleic acid-binding protein